MDERERDRLLSKLNLLEDGLETELEELRQSRRALGDRNPQCPLCQEIAFLAEYVDRFSSDGIRLAKEASRHRLALEIVRERCQNLHERFDRHIAGYRRSRLLLGGRAGDPVEKTRVLRRFEAALRTAVMRLKDAEYDFYEMPLARRQQPSTSVVDRWIEKCSATNSKEAWRQISNQRDFPRPLWKVFYERWKNLRPAKPGRPKKRRD